MKVVPGFLRGVGLALMLLVAEFFLAFTAWFWEYDYLHGRWWETRGSVWLAFEGLVTLLALYWLTFRARPWQLYAFVAAAVSLLLFLFWGTGRAWSLSSC